MAKLMARISSWIVAAALTIPLSACSGPEIASPTPVSTKITYKCLSSSCDAVVTCAEDDAVPEHCGKRMIR